MSHPRPAAPIIAIGAGALVGSALRDTPLAIVDAAFTSGGEPAADCGVEAAADCAIRNTPWVLVELARFGLSTLAVGVFLALVGTVGAVWGWSRLRTTHPTQADEEVDVTTRSDRVGLGLLAAGTALMMPALWLVVSLAASGTAATV